MIDDCEWNHRRKLIPQHLAPAQTGVEARDVVRPALRSNRAQTINQVKIGSRERGFVKTIKNEGRHFKLVNAHAMRVEQAQHIRESTWPFASVTGGKTCLHSNEFARLHRKQETVPSLGCQNTRSDNSLTVLNQSG